MAPEGRRRAGSFCDSGRNDRRRHFYDLGVVPKHFQLCDTDDPAFVEDRQHFEVFALGQEEAGAFLRSKRPEAV